MSDAAVASSPAPAETPKDLMKEIVALCKRRGFIYPASDIYGGINGFWDFGPLGTELKNNIRDLWWKAMVKCPPIGPDGNPVRIVGLDSAIIQNPQVWVASGHVGGFSDPMRKCPGCGKFTRADHLWDTLHNDSEWVNSLVGEFGTQGRVDTSTILKWAKSKGKKLAPNLAVVKNPEVTLSWLATRVNGQPDAYPTMTEIIQHLATEQLNATGLQDPCPRCGGALLGESTFNLLMKTYLGVSATEDDVAYLRGETAQGIFINYKNILDSSRVRVPFGIAQVGKAFRNEVNPRNFIFRSREFEQMEMEWFCHPDDAEMWFNFWKEERRKWWLSIGVGSDNIIFREHDADELVFYSKMTFDVEYKFPFTAPGYGELEGIAYRTNYDLGQHEKFSGTKMEYMDPMDNTKRYVPHVIEPAAGLTRGVLAVLCEAFTLDPNRPAGMYLNFHPNVAPIKAAILPLTEKDGQPEIAQKLYMELRQDYMVELDVKQNIGKRYARQDEIGTPFCFTVDTETATDKCVTVRHRNTMKQERVPLDKVKEYLAENLKKMVE